MNIKFINYLFIFLAQILFLSCEENAAPESRSVYYEKVRLAVDSVRRSLESQINKNVPSLNLLIHTPGEYIFVSTVHSGVSPITKDTYFRFASNTKTFTSTVILNMQEQGWLNINSLITDVIPGSSIPYTPNTAEWNIPNKNLITIKHLLQHSAGVYDVDNDTVPGCGGMSYVQYKLTQNPLHQFSSTELVEQVTINNLSYFLPGTNHHYSNTGYTILGEIAARVYSFRSGSTKNLTNYLNDFVVGGSAPVPLNAHFPYLSTDTQLPSPYVSGTIIDRFGITIIYTEHNMSAHVAEGNGYGTMNELDKYIRSLMKGSNVLTSGSIELMKNEFSPGDTTYALGCIKVTNLGYGHNGAICGYLSYMLYDPAYDASVIIMMPFWDESGGFQSFLTCFKTLVGAGYAARKVLGLPGNP
jgi:D-alanyl-D-alanine carboxypeptidase